MIRPIAAVVFDIDGTLLDTEGLFRDAFLCAAERFGLAVGEAAYQRLIGVPTLARCRALANGAGIDIDAFCAAYRAERSARLLSGIPVKPGADAALMALAGMGLRLAAATSASRATALAHLRRAAMLDMIDVVVARDDVTRAKPAPDAFILAMRLLRRRPAETIAVEDSVHGLHAAISAGLRVVLIPDLAPLDTATRAMAWRVEPDLGRVPTLDLQAAFRNPPAAGPLLDREQRDHSVAGPVHLVVFGLSVSSAWGNGHAPLWRALIGALAADGHAVTFFERDRSFYARNRDLTELPAPCELVLFGQWTDVLPTARATVRTADAAMVTSFCPDGLAATELIAQHSRGLRCFYDLDTPVTLAALDAGRPIEAIGPCLLQPFDLVLSYTGGAALYALRSKLGAQRVRPLYGWVDPSVHRPVAPDPHYAAELSYFGTYADDRQRALERLFVEPARRLPDRRFVIGGAQYPATFPWAANIWFVRHVPPAAHAAFYSASRITLNVTRQAMARMGWCPSGRLFEAAACGTPVLSDWWEGLDAFFTPGEEILIANDTADTLAAMERSDAELRAIARRARARALDQHTAAVRAGEMLQAFEDARAERGVAA